MNFITKLVTSWRTNIASVVMAGTGLWLLGKGFLFEGKAITFHDTWEAFAVFGSALVHWWSTDSTPKALATALTAKAQAATVAIPPTTP